jgi:hypothetical protein
MAIILAPLRLLMFVSTDHPSRHYVLESHQGRPRT